MALQIKVAPGKERLLRVFPKSPPRSGLGRLRKIALLGGAHTLAFAPWTDPTWELWAHMSCRRQCAREPDVYFDLHPPELWRDKTKKYWDQDYMTWLAHNRTPIYMQQAYPDVPAAVKYPFEQIVTEFPRGYMTNTVAYMVALALTEGVTHLGVYGCHYVAASEYGPQRGCAEYWLGLAEGRGVHIGIPPKCDLLNRPSLLYGYESHPNGVRHPSYSFGIGVYRPDDPIPLTGKPVLDSPDDLIPADHPAAPPLRNIGVPPALHRRAGELTGN